MGIVCRGAMHGFAALPSAIMDATAVELAPKAPAPLLWRQPKAASHNGGWEGRKTMHRTPTNNTHTLIRARFSNFRKKVP